MRLTHQRLLVICLTLGIAGCSAQGPLGNSPIQESNLQVSKVDDDGFDPHHPNGPAKSEEKTVQLWNSQGINQDSAFIRSGSYITRGERVTAYTSMICAKDSPSQNTCRYHYRVYGENRNGKKWRSAEGLIKIIGTVDINGVKYPVNVSSSGSVRSLTGSETFHNIPTQGNVNSDLFISVDTGFDSEKYSDEVKSGAATYLPAEVGEIMHGLSYNLN